MFNDTDYLVLNSQPGVSVGTLGTIPASTDPVVIAAAIPPVSDTPATTVATTPVVAIVTAEATTPTSTGVVVVDTTTATPVTAASTSVVTATITHLSAVIEKIPGIDKKEVFTQLLDDDKEESIKEMELEKNENKSE